MHEAFHNRQVVVTGGTGALGARVVDALLRAGARCAVPWINQQEAERFEHREHERVRLLGPLDLTDERAVADFYEQIDAPWASIHIAGGFAMSPVEKTSLDDWRSMLDTNTTSCFLCCREAIKRMRAAGAAGEGEAGEAGGAGAVGGRIVNVAARPALEPAQGANMAAYTASKAAVAALTQALAAEAAPDGVWINAVAPSIIDTPANRKAMPDADHDAWPHPDDIARTILFLASPNNRVTRGAVVPVYGRA